MVNPVTSEFQSALAQQLPEETFRELNPSYSEEPRGRFGGRAALLLAPASTQEVATIISACNAASVGVVPYGGGTGLVGGQIAPEGTVLLSLERMAKIRSVLPRENVLIAEAGVILETIQNAADQVDRVFPLSLASQGSARIGGNLATNAGGVNVLRYGNARDLCLGIEAVLPDGAIFDGLTRLRKDNTGYDLRHLLVGSEGTLGVITAASLKLFPKPRDRGAAVVAVPSPEAAVTLFGLAGDCVGSQIEAFELINRSGLDFLEETGISFHPPMSNVSEWMVLIDIGTFADQSPQELLEDFFSGAMEAALVSDGVIAQSIGQRQQFWAIRENIPEANRRIGSVSSHDISIPLGHIPSFIERADAALAKLGPFRINCFGHVGDGNLHYNVFPPKGRSRDDFANLRPDIKSLVHDLTHELEGSVSAEHGIGRLKVPDLVKYSDSTKLKTLRAIKSAIDPKGIMNPGALIPEV